MEAQVAAERADETDRLEVLRAGTESDQPLKGTPVHGTACGALSDVGATLPREGIGDVLRIRDLRVHGWDDIDCYRPDQPD
ncbi:MAG: hypothetical protein WBW93_14430 [Steroidobacteraceae bacterium]